VVKRTLAAAQVREALEPYGLPVLDAEVPQAQALAMSYGNQITDAHAYTDVLTELVELMKK
jgi:chromosome partitioning protein